jgi:hypothetical protein
MIRALANPGLRGVRQKVHSHTRPCLESEVRPPTLDRVGCVSAEGRQGSVCSGVRTSEIQLT